MQRPKQSSKCPIPGNYGSECAYTILKDMEYNAERRRRFVASETRGRGKSRDSSIVKQWRLFDENGKLAFPPTEWLCRKQEEQRIQREKLQRQLAKFPPNVISLSQLKQKQLEMTTVKPKTRTAPRFRASSYNPPPAEPISDVHRIIEADSPMDVEEQLSTIRSMYERDLQKKGQLKSDQNDRLSKLRESCKLPIEPYDRSNTVRAEKLISMRLRKRKELRKN